MKTLKTASLAAVIIGNVSVASGFAPSIAMRSQESRILTRTFAAGGGAPQYDKVDASLIETKVLGEGSVLVRVGVDGPSGATVDYEPGHVLALEIMGPYGDADGEVDSDASKSEKDAAKNGGWMRAPYTVSRATDTTFDIIMKVVGEKSERYRDAKPGEAVRFGGKFKVPILAGICGGGKEADPDGDFELPIKAVLISTGVGAGPCVGAIEKALLSESATQSFPPIHFIASYRNEAEVLYREHLDALEDKHPGRFSWTPVITSDAGRLSSSTQNLKNVLECNTLQTPASSIDATHYHLIGNGGMVSEFKAGLKKAGVPDGRVTFENYFNHSAAIDEKVVDRIAAVVSDAAKVTVEATATEQIA